MYDLTMGSVYCNVFGRNCHCNIIQEIDFPEPSNIIVQFIPDECDENGEIVFDVVRNEYDNDIPGQSSLIDTEYWIEYRKINLKKLIKEACEKMCRELGRLSDEEALQFESKQFMETLRKRHGETIPEGAYKIIDSLIYDILEDEIEHYYDCHRDDEDEE